MGGNATSGGWGGDTRAGAVMNALSRALGGIVRAQSDGDGEPLYRFVPDSGREEEEKKEEEEGAKHESPWYVLEFDRSGSGLIPLGAADQNQSAVSASALRNRLGGGGWRNLIWEGETQQQQQRSETVAAALTMEILWHRVTLQMRLYPAEDPGSQLGEALARAIDADVNGAVTEWIADGSLLSVLKEDREVGGGKVIAVSNGEGGAMFSAIGADNVLGAEAEKHLGALADLGFMDPLRIVGIVLFVLVSIFAFLLFKVAKRNRKKRIKDEIWGTLLKSDQDLNNLLSVGLVMSIDGDHETRMSSSREDGPFAPSSKGGEEGSFHSHGNGDPRNILASQSQQPRMVAKVYDEEEMGYSKDNSMLMGGYQRTAHILTHVNVGPVGTEGVETGYHAPTPGGDD